MYLGESDSVGWSYLEWMECRSCSVLVRKRWKHYYYIQETLIVSSFLRDMRVPTNHLAAMSSLRDFDLSRNESLRTLQVTAQCVGLFPDATSDLLKQVLSTVTSPSFFEVVVLYRWPDFGGVGYSWLYSNLPPLHKVLRADGAAEVLRHHSRFKVFSEAHDVRNFRLVLDANVWDPAGEHSLQMLKEAIAKEKAKNGFDEDFPEPLVTYHPRRSRYV